MTTASLVMAFVGLQVKTLQIENGNLRALVEQYVISCHSEELQIPPTLAVS